MAVEPIEADLKTLRLVMLTANRLSDAVKVIACDMYKTDGPFYCPICGTETILHRGPIKIAHFAHKPPTTCEYGRGESERQLAEVTRAAEGAAQEIHHA